MKNISLTITVIFSLAIGDIIGGGLREFTIANIENGPWYEFIKNELIRIDLETYRLYGLEDDGSIEKGPQHALQKVIDSQKLNRQTSNDISSYCYQQAFATRAMKMLSLIAYYGIKVLDVNKYTFSNEKVYDLVRQGYYAITFYSDNHISYRFWDFDRSFEAEKITKEMKKDTRCLYRLLRSMVERVYDHLGLTMQSYIENHEEVFGTLTVNLRQGFDIFYVFRDRKIREGVMQHLEAIVDYAKKQYEFNENLKSESGYDKTFALKLPENDKQLYYKPSS